MVKLQLILNSLRKGGYKGDFRVSRYRWMAKGAEYLFEGRKEVKIEEPFDGKTVIRSKHVIRFAKGGCTNRPFYRIVLSHKWDPIDAEIEQLGTFDPYPNLHNEKLCSLNFDRIKHHLALGAYPSRGVRRLLGLSGFLPLDPTLIIWAENLRRRRRIEQLIAEKKAKEEADNE